jgi:hypothetical protein
MKDETPMPYNPRLPQGCDQQGRYPMAAEPCVDPDEIGGKPWYQEQPEPESWWPKIVGVIVAIIVIVAVFAPVGVGK